MTLFQVEAVMYFRNLMTHVMLKTQSMNYMVVNSWVRGKIIVIVKYAVSDPYN